MGSSAGTASETPHAAPRAAPLVALFHPDTARAARLAAAIVTEGWRVEQLSPPAAGLRPWLDGCFDLLVLNPYLGWQEPAEFIRLARSIAGSRPMLVLSDCDSVADRLLALRGGADDAAGWTGNLPEVLARVAGLLHRAWLTTGQIGAGELRIDLIDRRVERAGRLIRLPLREFDLLAQLARVPDRPISRTALLQAVWRLDFDPGTNRVEVHMSRLRAKVDRGFAWPMLRTVKGQGYALSSQPDQVGLAPDGACFLPLA